MNLLHLWSICLLISIGYSLHRHVNSPLRKNLSQYSSIEELLTMALVALAHNKFEWPKYFSQDPSFEYASFEYISLIVLRSSSRRSRKVLSLLSETWNVIFYLFSRSSHSFCQLNSHEDLHRNREVKLNFLVSLSTILWSDQLSWLGHS